MHLKRLLSLLTCSLILTLSSVAQALPEDSNQPIHISADSASINEKTGVTVYKGRVEIVQGSMKIRGDRVELYRNAKGDVDRIISVGQPAKFEQQPKAKQPITYAYGKRMEYSVNKQEVTITTEARVKQDKDVFTGERIVYNMNKAVVDAYSSESGGQRVQMVIQPKANNKGSTK